MNSKINIIIRKAIPEDLPSIIEIYNQGVKDGTANSDLNSFTSEEKRAWFESHTPKYPIWVAESNKEVVGWTNLSPYENKECFHKSASISTYVLKKYRGHGIGSKLRAHLIQKAKELGFHTLVNRVFASNTSSIQLAKKFKFKLVGRMRDLVHRDNSYEDCVFFQLMLDEK
jgi:L-amino acid N-acyltransferase YncA